MGMTKICSVCGLPKDICVCSDISKSSYDIEVKLERRKYRKTVTIISGLELKNSEMKKLASELKSRCSSGGTVKNGSIELQGDHRRKVTEILRGKGFNIR